VLGVNEAPVMPPQAPTTTPVPPLGSTPPVRSLADPNTTPPVIPPPPQNGNTPK